MIFITVCSGLSIVPLALDTGGRILGLLGELKVVFFGLLV